jgi:hypothetical protein
MIEDWLDAYFDSPILLWDALCWICVTLFSFRPEVPHE